MDAPEYFCVPELPDKPMFRCLELSATLSVCSCAKRWVLARKEDADESSLWHCRHCAIGAMHAGVKTSTQSPLFNRPVCVRCGQTTTRLINRSLCVSCQNREYEYIKGKNARGNPPKAHPLLYRAAVRVWSAGKIRTLVRNRATGVVEAVIEALRDDPDQATFGFVPPRSPMPDLWSAL